MLLSANGQNIYPEEIESQLNNLPYIAESLVIMRHTKLIAMVWPDIPAMKENNIPEKRLKEIMEENKGILNQSVAQYERISAIEIVDMEFEKTPKKPSNVSSTSDIGKKSSLTYIRSSRLTNT